MTSTQDRNAESKHQDPQGRGRKIDEGHELDAEIVSDLELDEGADGIRGGGNCGGSHNSGCGATHTQN